MLNATRRRNLHGLLLVFPAFLLVLVILFLPTINTIGMSLADFSFLKGSASRFTGLRNYARIFADEEFRSSLGNTFVFTAVTVFLELSFGMVLALIVNRAFAFRGVMRTTILFPWMLPTALNAVVWRWLYNTDFGFFNNLLRGLHLTDSGVNWLGGIPLAMISMMIVAVWKTSSFMALILLTGLQTIPTELYQAARVDGAGPLQIFRRLTLPLLAPSILVALLFRSMDAFRAFELPFALTNGGPAGTTQTLSLFGYRQFFQFLKFDAGSAVSVVQFLIIFALGLAYLGFFRMERE